MKIVDYIYYRLYKMYKKHNEPARFSSSLIKGDKTKCDKLSYSA